MRLSNATPLSATIVRNAERDDRIRILGVAAVTADITPKGLVLSEEQLPLETAPDSRHPNDVVFSRAGITSVCATGFAYPTDAGDRQSVVRLRVGDKDLDIAVFGERRWRRGVDGAPTPSRPEPIERVPMAWTHAYGGKVKRPPSRLEVDGTEMILCGHEASYPHNTDGLGFALDRKDAIGEAMPQLEDPQRLVQRWDDYPEPVCFAPYPMSGGLRARFIVDGTTIDKTRIPDLHSRAAPRNTFAPIEPGIRIALAGMSQPDALAFTVPDVGLSIAVSVGDDRQSFDFALDAIDIDAEARQVRLLYRTGFRYDLFQFERRVASLSTAVPLQVGSPLSSE